MAINHWITEGIATLGAVMHAAGSLQYNRLSNNRLKHAARRFTDLLPKATEENQWFSQENTQYALLAYGELLESIPKASLPMKKAHESTMAIIPPGLSPFDGLEDIALSLASGYKASIKQRSKNDLLIPAAVETLREINPQFNQLINIQKGPLRGFHKILASVPKNNNQQWHKYLGKYPGYLREWNTTAAIITGDETLNELEQIANGILRFFKQAPENINILYVPENYSLKLLDEPFKPFEREMKQHTQWFNNYEYQKSMAILNAEKYHDNGFLLFKYDGRPLSPPGVVHIKQYAHTSALKNHLINKDKKLYDNIVSTKEQPFCSVIQPHKLFRPQWQDQTIQHKIKKING